jgi:transmembrane sensor
MQKEEFINIAGKVSEGLANDQEKQLFLFHLGAFATQNPEWEKLAPEFRQQIEDEIKSDIRVQVFIEDKQKSKAIKLWPRIIGIAVAIALVVLGVYFFNYRNDKHTDSNVLATQDISPGTVGATLTLANGKKIKLSEAADGEIAKEAGISVTKTADGQLVYQIKETTGDPNKINRLSTAKGETYILTLPDKSKVWLNAASSLTYSATLNERGLRRVRLEGEAYFEIFKDKVHPFIVQTAKQDVEVLGTHFNINSYADEPATATTLLEGSVKVTAGNLKQILKPGEQALNMGKTIEVTTADIENVTDWKNGDFFLNRVDFRTAMRKIARWYDVEVIYDASVSDDIQSSGYISRSKKLSSVLKLIEKSGQVHFKIEGRRIYVSK